jgi:transcriptional regulator with XRE-family HTH domain
MGRSPSALSQWETGRRRSGRLVTLRDLQALDVVYGAQGALVDIALSVGTPAGLPARTCWAHNPQGPSGPAWAWLRPRRGAGRVVARLLWGAFRLDLAEPCDDRGLFVTTPMSMPNPAVWVHLRESGWVDFGRGPVPSHLGIRTVDALVAADLGTGGHSAAGLVAPNVAARFEEDEEWAEEVLEFLGHRRDLVRSVFRAIPTREIGVDLSDSGDGTGPVPAGFSGAEYRALREARRLSQTEVARLVTRLMPEDPVSDDQVGLVERDRTPRSRFLRARLDQVYRADGHTCVERVNVMGVRSPFCAELPAFWIGPIWFTFRANTDAMADARIEWGQHHKRMRVRSSTTVTCRRPTTEPTPFVVCCPEGWTVEAGLGARPDARDVNWGWFRIDDDQLKRPPVNDVFLGWFGRTSEEFAQLWEGDSTS